MSIRSRGVGLLRSLARLGLVALGVLFVVVSVMTSIGIPGINNVTDLPEIPPVDQATMDRATATQGGQVLLGEGRHALLKIEDPDLIGFLDEQEKRAGVSNPGPYVLFGRNSEPVETPDGATANAVVDATNGVIVALDQRYTNKRAAACSIARHIDDLRGNWVVLNVYLRGKSMPQQIPVNHELVGALPAGFPDTTCYVYPS